MIESKALAQVAVRIICLVSPLRLSARALTPWQNCMKLHRPKWEHPPRRHGGTERVYCQRHIQHLTMMKQVGVFLFMGRSAADRHLPAGYVAAPRATRLPCPEF